MEAIFRGSGGLVIVRGLVFGPEGKLTVSWDGKEVPLHTTGRKEKRQFPVVGRRQRLQLQQIVLSAVKGEEHIDFPGRWACFIRIPPGMGPT